MNTNILVLLLLAVSMMIMTSCVKCDPCISEGISSPETLCIVQIMLSLNCFCLFVPICIAVTYGHLLRRALLTKFVLHITTVLECFLNYPDHVVLVTCLYIIQCCLLVNSYVNLYIILYSELILVIIIL